MIRVLGLRVKGFTAACGAKRPLRCSGTVAGVQEYGLELRIRSLRV